MSNKEIIDYLKSLHCYKDEDMFYEQKMLEDNATIQVRDLVERFVEVDKEYNNSDWNILQILTNIRMI